VKTALGILIAFATGFVCRALGIPSPAPPVLTGALLVLAMTVGYVSTDRVIAKRAARSRNGNGPRGGDAASGDTP
jgi:XapX domain-containing protein